MNNLFTQRLEAIEESARVLEDDVEAFVARASLAELNAAVDKFCAIRHYLITPSHIITAALREMQSHEPSGVSDDTPATTKE